MSRPKVYTLHLADGPGLAFSMPVTQFDSIVDEGYDVINIVTPRRRYTAGVDEWQDYGYYDVSNEGLLDNQPDVEVIVLNKSYMGR